MSEWKEEKIKKNDGKVFGSRFTEEKELQYRKSQQKDRDKKISKGENKREREKGNKNNELTFLLLQIKVLENIPK